METQIQTLKSIVENNPNDQRLQDEIKKLKFKIFSDMATKPNDLNVQRVAMKYCELEVLYCLARQNIEEYKLAVDRWRNVCKITKKTLGVSDNFYQLQGVYLLYLISFNQFIAFNNKDRIEQFYFEIELLPLEGLQNPSISFVTQIEQALSIGNYSAVIQNAQLQETGLQSVFLNRIINTIRDQKAMSAQVSYQQIKIENALQLFDMKNLVELQQYAKSQNFNWKFDNEYVYLDQNKKSSNPLNSDALVKNQLNYVHELDKIV